MSAILDSIGDFFIKLGNYGIEGLGEILKLVLALLPDSPFRFVMTSPIGEYISMLNWILPIKECLATLQLWAAAILVYYMYAAVLRWIKAIE